MASSRKSISLHSVSVPILCVFCIGTSPRLLLSFSFCQRHMNSRDYWALAWPATKKYFWLPKGKDLLTFMDAFCGVLRMICPLSGISETPCVFYDNMYSNHCTALITTTVRECFFGAADFTGAPLIPHVPIMVPGFPGARQVLAQWMNRMSDGWLARWIVPLGSFFVVTQWSRTW